MRACLESIGLACLLWAVPLSLAAQAAPAAAAPTPEQQKIDETECGALATQQTGYDPARPPTAVATQPAPVAGSGARMRGAAAGATVAAIGGNDTGNGAAKGAVVGGVARRNQNRRAAAQANQAATQQAAASADAYKNARTGCLRGRGYQVN